MDNVNSYFINKVEDYDGPSVEAGLENFILEEIIDWYYSLPQARDLTGWDAEVVDSYKTTATEALFCLADVRTDAFYSDAFYRVPEESQTPTGVHLASVARIEMGNIIIPNEEYFTTADNEPEIEAMDPDPVAGIVTGSYDGKWVLIQGYERYKQGLEAWGNDYLALFVVIN